MTTRGASYLNPMRRTVTGPTDLSILIQVVGPVSCGLARFTGCGAIGAPAGSFLGSVAPRPSSRLTPLTNTCADQFNPLLKSRRPPVDAALGIRTLAS